MNAGRLDFQLGLETTGAKAALDGFNNAFIDLDKRTERNLKGAARLLTPTALAFGFSAAPQFTATGLMAVDALDNLGKAASVLGIGFGSLALAVTGFVAVVGTAVVAIQAIQAQRALDSRRLAAMDQGRLDNRNLMRIAQEARDSGEISSATFDMVLSALEKPGGFKQANELLRLALPNDKVVAYESQLANLRAGAIADPFEQAREIARNKFGEDVRTGRANAKAAGYNPAEIVMAAQAALDAALERIDAEQAKAGKKPFAAEAFSPAEMGRFNGASNLEKMGFVFDGGANPVVDFTRRTAHATERTAKAVEKLSGKAAEPLVNN